MNHSIMIYVQYGQISTLKWIITEAMFCLCKTTVTIYLLLSGVLLLKKDESYEDWFSKRILRILIVLFTWSAIYIFMNNGNEIPPIPQIISSTLSNESSIHLWYMLIGIYMLLPFLCKMVKVLNTKDWMIFLAIWLIFSGIIPYYNAIFTSYPLILNQNFSINFLCGYTAVYIMGYLIDSQKVSKRYFLISVVVFFSSWILNVIVTYFVSVNQGFATRNFDSPIILPVMLCAFSLLYIAKCFNNKFEGKNTLIIVIISELSACTFGIYLIHPLILNWIWSHYTHSWYIRFLSNYALSIHQTVFLNVITFIISAIIISLIRRIPILKRIV